SSCYQPRLSFATPATWIIAAISESFTICFSFCFPTRIYITFVTASIVTAIIPVVAIIVAIAATRPRI
ncbi:MAG TPA: hypothetical protein DC053_01465, partial [Lachnoclostridium sp.]|nr:hypothetical protein [Lachnoclostridium sp.]